MFRSVFVILLINTSYRSLGNPLSATTVLRSLTTLADHCENNFLSNQIKNNIANCSNPSSPNDEKQLQCMIFYDINKQLCEAIITKKIALHDEDYTIKINEEQDVSSLCVTAKDWVFSNLTKLLHYKQAVDKVFKHPVSCGKICGVDDFTSFDANYFCKYFKWGTDILKQVTTISTQDNTVSAQLQPEPANINNKVGNSAPSSSDLQDYQIKNFSSTESNALTNNKQVGNNEVEKPEVQPETSSLIVKNNSQSFVSTSTGHTNTAAANNKPIAADFNFANVENTGAMPENALNAKQHRSSKSPEESLPPRLNETSAQDLASKPDSLGEMQNKLDDHKNDMGKDLPLSGKDLPLSDKDLPLSDKDLPLSEDRQSMVETHKGKQQNFNVEDYQDPGDGHEGLADMQGGDDGDGDGDDGDVDDSILGDQEPKPEIMKPVVKKTEIIETAFTGEKGSSYVSPAQDAFPDDDDHFFPFFLTAIILVVLLYVLYHNKNKVGKVFFGLMLEGRQATRRRNSRGHAYRRLDTLEQAMTANSAAPPSKIIY